MNTALLLGELRELIGNPEPSQVSNRQLLAHLVPAAEWLAQELQFNIAQDDTGVGLVAGQQEYTLPPEYLWVMWLVWNNQRLDTRTVWQWDREGPGWRQNVALDVLTEYAIHGRQLLLHDPPSALAVTTDPYLHIRAVIAPPLLSGEGMIGLSDMDQYLLVCRAALRYCRSHPSDNNNLLSQNYAAEIAEHLPLAKRRVERMSQTQYPSFLPYTERTGGARRAVRIQQPLRLHFRHGNEETRLREVRL